MGGPSLSEQMWEGRAESRCRCGSGESRCRCARPTALCRTSSLTLKASTRCAACVCSEPSSSLPPCCISARAHARVHGVRALVCTAVHGAVEYSGYRMGATTVAREHCGRYQNVQEPLMDATSGAAQVGLYYR